MDTSIKRQTELRLLIVDGQRLFREGLRALFSQSRDVEAMAAAPEEAAQRSSRFRVHVAVIGLATPRRPTFAIAEKMAAQRPAPRLLFLDEQVRPVNLAAALQAGAVGYWTKCASFDELTAAVRRVAAGKPSFCHDARDYLVAGPAGSSVRINGKRTVAADITHRETEVLGLLVEGLSVKECARRMKLSPSTIDNHKSRLMKKLGIHKTTGLVRFAVREGLVKA